MEWAFLLTLEHLFGWLPMFIAGVIAFRARGVWRWLGIALGLLTIFPLPGMWENNPQFAFLEVMFMAVGGLAGSLLGILLQRRGTPAVAPRWTHQGHSR